MIAGLLATLAAAPASAGVTPVSGNDNLADAFDIVKGEFYEYTRTGSTIEVGEPFGFPHTCSGQADETIWFDYTPTEDDVLLYGANWAGSTGWDGTIGVWTGETIDSLSMVRCWVVGGWEDWLPVSAGTTYHFQVGWQGDVAAPGWFHTREPDPPGVMLDPWPADPSIYDTVTFNYGWWDIAGQEIAHTFLDFGDGSTATDDLTHRYVADGDYTVSLTITTVDGREATTSYVLPVRTHDVRVSKFTAPVSARANQTRQLIVSVDNRRTDEWADVVLSRAQGDGWAELGTQRVLVRAGAKPANVTFSYRFTKEDASIGKVTFQASVRLADARDGFPKDNDAYSTAIVH